VAIVAAFMAIAGGAELRAQEVTRLVSVQPSSIKLNGSSNIARWECKGATISGRFEVSAPLEEINRTIDELESTKAAVFSIDRSPSGVWARPDVLLRIPVSSLDCGNRIMERDMHNALKAEAHPFIEFRFKDIRGAIVHDTPNERFQARVSGDISLAGVTRTIDLTVNAQRVARDRFRLQATLPMRMTDFGIKPPTGLFGAIKARNQLVVTFDLMLQPTPPQTPSAAVTSSGKRR
jgi:hypothetical protein